MDDPFTEGHGQKPAPTTSSGPSSSKSDPKTPTRSYGLVQAQTPARDPFASITSPQHFRVLLKESELMKKAIQKDLERQIKLRDDHIAKLQSEIQAMQARISQQEITIRNQSKAIEDPRSLRTTNSFVHAAPPFTRPVQTPTAGHTVNMQHGLPHAHPTLSSFQNQGVMSPYVNHQASAQMSMQHKPDGASVGTQLTRNEPIVPIMEPVSQSRGAPLQQPTVTAGSYPSGEAVSTFPGPSYLGFEFETKATEFGAQFRSLWEKSERFARSYGLNAKKLNPQDLDASLKDYMMLDGDVDIASLYLNNSLIRPLYVAKVINFYLCKRVLKHTEIVRGFDSNADAEIANLKKMIVHDTPPVARHSILEKIADQVNFVRQKPNFKMFCHGSRDGHSYHLLAMLEPLLSHHGNHGRESHLALIEVIEAAQNIALDLYSCPFDARLHFPEIGEPYDSSCMTMLDIKDSGFSSTVVRMSVTPFVRLGLNQTDPARVRIVSSANIFTCLPREGNGFTISLKSGRP